MAEYIDRDELVESIEYSIGTLKKHYNGNPTQMVDAYKNVLYRVKNMRTADVVEAVRCKNCKYAEHLINGAGADYKLCRLDEEVQAERLREERGQKYEQIELICSLRNKLAEKDKELIRLNKEVDRLSQYVLYNEEYINDHYWDFCSIAGCERVSNDCWKTCPYSRYSKVKSKIIKEFAEMLKKECLIDRGYEILHEGTVDNLVKEMVDDTE